MLLIPKILNNFLPLILSKDPCETPMVSINIKQIIVEILRSLFWSIIITNRFVNKKKRKE